MSYSVNTVHIGRDDRDLHFVVFASQCITVEQRNRSKVLYHIRQTLQQKEFSRSSPQNLAIHQPTLPTSSHHLI